MLALFPKATYLPHTCLQQAAQAANSNQTEAAAMSPDDFLVRLQAHTASFAKAVATNEGGWIIKGFIDVYRRIYTISVDTKITSKVLELLLFPMFVEFAKDSQALEIERPYTNLTSYLEYKRRGIDTLRAHESEIADLGDDDPANGKETENGGEQ